MENRAIAENPVLDEISANEENKLRLEWKDIIAIVIAIYKTILPWTLIIAGMYALLLLAYKWLLV